MLDHSFDDLSLTGSPSQSKYCYDLRPNPKLINLKLSMFDVLRDPLITTKSKEKCSLVPVPAV